MSPVVAVCPKHGEFASRNYHFSGSRNVTIQGVREPCPTCGRLARVMEGTFDFDPEGIATVIAAPGWSRHALESVQRSLRMAAKALQSPTYSDARAFAMLDKKLDQIRSEARHDTAQSRRRQQELADEVAKLRRKLDRRGMSKVLLGIVFALGVIADGGAVAQMGEEAVSWVVEQIIEGSESGAP